MNECIDERVKSLKLRHINKRKKHVLSNKLHLDALHENVVLFPADEVANNNLRNKWYVASVPGLPHTHNL